MTRILILLGLLMAWGLAAMAQGAVVAGAPASDEITVVRMIPVNNISLEALTQALGGQLLFLFGGQQQPLGVVNNARDAMNNLFPGNRQNQRDIGPAPLGNAQPAPPAAVPPAPLFGPGR